jgi:hypothetical protein
LLLEMMNTEVSVPMLRIDNKYALSLIKNPKQMGDILTKPLNKNKFRKFCLKIGLKVIQ